MSDEKKIELDLDSIIDKLNGLIDLPFLSEKSERVIIAFVLELLLSMLQVVKKTLV